MHVDCIDHRGLGQKVPVALDGVAMHEWVAREWALVDVGGDERFGDGGGLGDQRDGKSTKKTRTARMETSAVTRMEN
jgi:hypothetical protein